MRLLALRGEEPPEPTVVIVRGGEMVPDHVRRTAIRAFEEFGFYGVSVFAALDIDIAQLCAREPQLSRYGKIRLSTVGRLRQERFALIPTLHRPHFDLVLPDVSTDTLGRLEGVFDVPIPNPARRPKGTLEIV